jgi:SAM-dependent methyltransferase
MREENFTWEETVAWIKSSPQYRDIVLNCYYDDPLWGAAKRYAASEEWIATRDLLSRKTGKVLDLGAGRGISSYALAQDGWQVVAFDPDHSADVGANSIVRLVNHTGVNVKVVEGYGEKLPFSANSFDLVYGRQVLHHAHELALMCSEVARVLKPRGEFIATREHIISRRDDLNIFLNDHPLNRFYGGENAFLLEEYKDAIIGSGLKLARTIGPFDSVINYAPLSIAQWQNRCQAKISKVIGKRLTGLLLNPQNKLGSLLLVLIAHTHTRLSQQPGRLYSFVAFKI